MISNRLYFSLFLVSFFFVFTLRSRADVEVQSPKLSDYHPQILFPFVFEQMNSILKLCLHDKSCELKDSERILVEVIQASLAKEIELNSKLIRFDSAKKNPALFMKDGHFRIAVTGDDVGDPIYINLDLAFQNDKYGKSHPLPLDRAIATLVHELGHHHGVKSHSELDQLGLKIGTYFNSKMTWTPINGSSSENQDPALRPLVIFLGTINFPFLMTKQIGLQNLVWIFDEYRITDVSNTLKIFVGCPGTGVEGTSRLLNWEAISWRFGEIEEIFKCASTGSRDSYRSIHFFTLTADLQLSCQEQYSKSNVAVELGFRRNCPNETVLLDLDANAYLFERIQNYKVRP